MRHSDRIVGGKFAPSNIPWQAQVLLGHNGYYKGMGHHCGATILDAETVLSAAHCFFAGDELIEKEKLPKKYHGKKFIDAMDASIRVGFTDQLNTGDYIQVHS